MAKGVRTIKIYDKNSGTFGDETPILVNAENIINNSEDIDGSITLSDGENQKTLQNWASQITVNTSRLTSLDSKETDSPGRVTVNENNIATNTSNITTNTSNITANKSSIDKNTSDINDIKDKLQIDGDLDTVSNKIHVCSKINGTTVIYYGDETETEVAIKEGHFYFLVE